MKQEYRENTWLFVWAFLELNSFWLPLTRIEAQECEELLRLLGSMSAALIDLGNIRNSSRKQGSVQYSFNHQSSQNMCVFELSNVCSCENCCVVTLVISHLKVIFMEFFVSHHNVYIKQPKMGDSW